MSFFSEKTTPTWVLITGGIACIVFVLVAVSLPKTFPRLKGGSYLGVAHFNESAAGQPPQDMPFMMSVPSDEESVTVQVFTAKLEPAKTQGLVKTYRFMRTAVNPVQFDFGDQNYTLIGRLSDDLLHASGTVTSAKKMSEVGTWSIAPIESSTSDKDRLRSSLTVWKQVQELARIRAVEEQRGADQKSEMDRLQETLVAQLEIKREGEKKLALASKAVDEAAARKKKLDSEVQVLRGRIVLAQGLSPQGKFYTLSRRAFQNEAGWFLAAYARPAEPEEKEKKVDIDASLPKAGKDPKETGIRDPDAKGTELGKDKDKDKNKKQSESSSPIAAKPNELKIGDNSIPANVVSPIKTTATSVTQKPTEPKNESGAKPKSAPVIKTVTATPGNSVKVKTIDPTIKAHVVAATPIRTPTSTPKPASTPTPTAHGTVKAPSKDREIKVKAVATKISSPTPTSSKSSVNDKKNGKPAQGKNVGKTEKKKDPVIKEGKIPPKTPTNTSAKAKATAKNPVKTPTPAPKKSPTPTTGKST